VQRSPSLDGLWNILSPEVSTNTTPLPAGSTLGQTSLTGDPRTSTIQFQWSQIGNIWQLADILAHELGHAGHRSDNGFSSSDAAPYISSDDYIEDRWTDEYPAYQFQAKILNELKAAMPASCFMYLLGSDLVLSDLVSSLNASAAGNAQQAAQCANQAMQDLTQSVAYNQAALTAAYQSYKGGTEISSSIPQDIRNYFNSSEWTTVQNTWSSFLTPGTAE
jgi:hypothetical protein